MGSAKGGTQQTAVTRYNLAEGVFIRLLRTTDLLQREVEGLLKPEGLSGSQYNVLRILRGGGPRGLCCREVGERMLTRDPDITRLLDGLEKRGLIERWRDRKDRRVVVGGLTRRGRALLAQLDAPLAELHWHQLGHLGDERLRQLSDLLRVAGKI